MASNKAINVILNLKDKFTKPIQGTKAEVKRFEREVKRVENNIKKSTSKMANDFKSMAKDMTKTAAGFTLKGMGAAAGLGAAGLTASLGAGLVEGMDYETYRVQLQTATKDTEKAAKVMKQAIDLANSTPFEAGQMVEGAAKFEALGLSAERWLGLAADMAGATGKSFDQAVEAIIDAAASGETERLKEFGILKEQLDGFDKKGSLVSTKAVEDSLEEIMSKRFKGGAEELSKTTKGMWSTVTGVYKNGMAKVVGIMEDGTVRQGSMLDKVRNIIGKVSTKMVEWQQDGTIDKLAAMFDRFLNGAIEGFKKVKTFIGETIDKVKEMIDRAGGMENIIGIIKNLTAVVIGIMIATKLWSLAMKMQELWTKRVAIMQGILNVIASINPWALVLGAVIIVLMLVVANFEKVKAVALDLWAKWLEIWESIKTKTLEVVASMKEKWDNFWQGLKDGAKGFANFFIDKINWCIEKLNGLLNFKMPKWLGGAEVSLGNIPTVPNFATGTQYHRGGLARINEGNRGEILNLPNGTQVVPNSVSKQQGSGTNISVPITIQGNIYGDKDLVERVGGMIASKVKLAITNV